MFVSGTINTERWAVTAFHGVRQGSLSADLSSVATMNMSVSSGPSNESLPDKFYSYGPKSHCPASASTPGTAGGTHSPGYRYQVSLDAEGTGNQCIFFHYFKVKFRLLKYISLKAGAGPHELPPPGPEQAGPQIEVGDDSVPDEADEDKVGMQEPILLCFSADEPCSHTTP